MHAGPLLHGFEFDGAGEFAAWLANERGDAVGLASLAVVQDGVSVLAGRQAHAAALLDEAHERYERLADTRGLAHPRLAAPERAHGPPTTARS